MGGHTPQKRFLRLSQRLRGHIRSQNNTTNRSSLERFARSGLACRWAAAICTKFSLKVFKSFAPISGKGIASMSVLFYSVFSPVSRPWNEFIHTENSALSARNRNARREAGRITQGKLL